jgi:Poly(ADP-ribose) polymerase catalytic domain
MTGLVHQKLGFHGTHKDNIESIIEKGFNAPTDEQKTHGKAIYTARDSSLSHDYTSHPKREMLGCRILAYSGELFGNIYAITQPHRVLLLSSFNMDINTTTMNRHHTFSTSPVFE